MKLKPTLAAVGVLALMLSTAGLNAAFADSGKGNGNGNGKPKANSHSTTHGNSNSASSHAPKPTNVAASNGKGALASELKGLNAVKANPNALENAAPGSQVGRIAAYRDAALVTADKQTTLTEAQTALAALPVPTRDMDAIDGAIAALDPLAADYAEQLAALELERDQATAYAEADAVVDAAATDLAAAQTAEDAALLTASNGRPLSPEAVAYIRSVLDL